MPLSAHLILTATLLCCFATIFAFPERMVQHCLCLKTTNVKMNMRQFQSIEILPARGSCPRTEVIITRKDKSKVCVNPKAKWIQEIIDELVKSYRK
ncbi:C-X-C motif chemokine 10 isoform X2 [Trichomycterus rosablanca]|uniref:C-X-C motif chemokine 10 isoform X2 n=1 Tax=Trichomycterus rosablanca TaxID=2290929 RepID=UPI002F351377